MLFCGRWGRVSKPEQQLVPKIKLKVGFYQGTRHLDFLIARGRRWRTLPSLPPLGVFDEQITPDYPPWAHRRSLLCGEKIASQNSGQKVVSKGKSPRFQSTQRRKDGGFFINSRDVVPGALGNLKHCESTGLTVERMHLVAPVVKQKEKE